MNGEGVCLCIFTKVGGNLFRYNFCTLLWVIDPIIIVILRKLYFPQVAANH